MRVYLSLSLSLSLSLAARLMAGMTVGRKQREMEAEIMVIYNEAPRLMPLMH